MGKPLSDEVVAAYYIYAPGKKLRVLESRDHQTVELTISGYDDVNRPRSVSLNREQWRALCNLRDRVRVES